MYSIIYTWSPSWFPENPRGGDRREAIQSIIYGHLHITTSTCFHSNSELQHTYISTPKEHNIIKETEKERCLLRGGVGYGYCFFWRCSLPFSFIFPPSKALVWDHHDEPDNFQRSRFLVSVEFFCVLCVWTISTSFLSLSFFCLFIFKKNCVFRNITLGGATI